MAEPAAVPGYALRGRPPTRRAEPAPRVEALARGLSVLSLFSEAEPCLRLNDIAQRAGLPLATVHRLVSTLEGEGYLERLPDQRLRPAPAVLTLGFAALQGQDLLQASAVALRHLAEVTGQTVNLGVLNGESVLYLVRLRSTDLVTANIQVGSRIPAVHSSMGKVLLAALPDRDLRRRVSSASLAAGRGPNAVRTLPQLRAQLATIRGQGWGCQDEELASGLRSVAAPVRQGTADTVVAAVNVAAQATVWPLETMQEKFLPALLEAAARVSRGLG